MICVECDRQATYSHIEDTVTTIYSCERHRCQACTALDGASDSLIATLTALRDRLREQHLHGADALDAAIERLAAIQRVQAVCGKPNPGPSWDSYVEGYNDALSVVQAAMVGDADA